MGKLKFTLDKDSSKKEEDRLRGSKFSYPSELEQSDSKNLRSFMRINLKSIAKFKIAKKEKNERDTNEVLKSSEEYEATLRDEILCDPPTRLKINGKAANPIFHSTI